MKAWKKYGFLLAYSIPFLWILGYLMGGAWNFLTPFFIFILIPLFDMWVGQDSQNFSDALFEHLSGQSYYKWITILWVPVQFAMLFFAFYVVSFQLLSFIYITAFILGLGLITGGIGITVAHELGHKSSRFERILSQILLLSVCYAHFYIEHNQGHHVRVATPEDPATSRRGETFYRFWLRSVVGSWLSAWRIEKGRLGRLGKSSFSIQNKMIWYAILPVLFAALATLVFSLWAGRWVWEVPILFFVQSLIAFTLLEQVNYIEHYGIVRQQKPNGKYERVNPLHSWNANHLISNLFLFHLQRHSDHHTFASRRYQVLKHHDQSPQLPTGYPAMILLCLFPPLWFKIMDEKLNSWERMEYSWENNR
jgi:alkane 1-monooxygenase